MLFGACTQCARNIISGWGTHFGSNKPTVENDDKFVYRYLGAKFGPVFNVDIVFKVLSTIQKVHSLISVYSSFLQFVEKLVSDAHKTKNEKATRHDDDDTLFAA